MINYLNLLRVKHWVKNLFIFIPLFFSSQLFDIHKFYNTTITFFAFSFIASFIYVINDINDVEFDRMHYEKKNRPIASKKIPILNGFFISLLFLTTGLFLLIYFTPIIVVFISITYILMNILYTLKLKNVPILDFVIISTGFIFRVFIGAEVNNIELSNLIIIMVFLFSVFIAVSKRRDDVIDFEKNNNINRKVVKDYTVEFMDKIITITSSILLVSYLIFILSDNIASKYDFKLLFFTFCIVLIGIFRYNQIVYVHNKGGSPIKIFYSDFFLIITVLSWVITFTFIIYFDL